MPKKAKYVKVLRGFAAAPAKVLSRPYPCRNRRSGVLDVFGFFWPFAWSKSCQVCGQPDDCGDCNHTSLSYADRMKIIDG